MVSSCDVEEAARGIETKIYGGCSANRSVTASVASGVSRRERVASWGSGE